MALPNPPTSGNGSKLFAVTYDAAGTNTAAAAKSVKQTTVNTEVLGHMGVGTHKDTDTYAAGDAVVLAAGLTGTTIKALAVNTDGELGIHDGGNSITVDGAVTVSGSVSITGTPNVAVTSLPATPAGTNNIGDVDILTIAAGTNTIGGIRDSGWDQTANPVLKGAALSVTATTEQSLLGADASNLYNIMDVQVSYWSGSGAPAAVRKIIIRAGTSAGGDPILAQFYIPPTANVCGYEIANFRMPLKASATNKPITCQVVDTSNAGAALGTSGEYSVTVLAYKTAS